MMDWKCFFTHKTKKVDHYSTPIQEFLCERCNKIVYLDNEGFCESYEGHEYTKEDYLNQRMPTDIALKTVKEKIREIAEESDYHQRDKLFELEQWLLTKERLARPKKNG